jgi:hypothetical protein
MMPTELSDQITKASQNMLVSARSSTYSLSPVAGHFNSVKSSTWHLAALKFMLRPCAALILVGTFRLA